jgi:alpha-L-fucosidase 2
MPALPKAWSDGSVKGMRVRGGFAVDIEWKDGKLTQAVLYGISNKTGKVEVRYGDKTGKFKVAKGKSIKLNSDR